MEEQRGPETRSADGGAEDGRDDPGATASEPADEPAEGVLTLVCFKCGKEYFFTSTRPPAGMSCEKCQGTVFREFFSPAASDEAARDFQDTTGRDLRPDDAEGDVLPGDVLDLNRE